jgi:hypothetical protein
MEGRCSGLELFIMIFELNGEKDLEEAAIA